MPFKIILFTCLLSIKWLLLIKFKWVKNKKVVSSLDTNLWSHFCNPHRELIFRNKWHPGTSEISKPPEMVVTKHFHDKHATKTTPVFLPADGEASWLLLPSLVTLLSGSTMQQKNTYFYILKVIGQVWESQKRISINTNHHYHQHSST